MRVRLHGTAEEVAAAGLAGAVLAVREASKACPGRPPPRLCRVCLGVGPPAGVVRGREGGAG